MFMFDKKGILSNAKRVKTILMFWKRVKYAKQEPSYQIKLFI